MKPLLAVLAGLALAGCETSPQAPAPTTQTAPRPSDAHEEKAPLTLSLEPIADEGGVLQLRANLDATAALPIPVELRVTVPPGARLVDGDERQSVDVAAGRTSRVFRIQHDAGSAPVKVTIHAVHPSRAWGLHADKFYPEPPKAAPTAPAVKAPLARPPFARNIDPRPEAH